MNEKYLGIFGMPHHQSSEHSRMSMIDRAAQFSSFAALTGHGDAIKEEARLVDEKIELDEEQIQSLNIRLNFICDNIFCRPQATITYFVPDARKKGGAYVTCVCRIKKVDSVNRVIFAEENNAEINIDDILEITGV